MQAFAQLLDRLGFTTSRTAKIALIADYLTRSPDPDRGWALAALTGALDLKSVPASAVRALMAARHDPLLFQLSYDYVGDLAETCALLWRSDSALGSPGLSEVVAALRSTTRAQAGALLAQYLDQLDATGRWALLKLATGGLRVGINARLAKTAVAKAFALDLADIEEVWHGLTPPYGALFAWGQGAADRPSPGATPVFRPFMLASPLEPDTTVDLVDYQAEWKWDGIRVQVARCGGEARVFSRTGDDISASFPEIAEAMTCVGTLDGELLVRDADGAPASFNAVQQRLGRKSVTAKMLREFPAFVRCYDILFDGDRDVRALSLASRQSVLAQFVARLPAAQFDLSVPIEAASWTELAAVRADARAQAQEGLMLKRRDGAYAAGRKVGSWFKWKRDPLTADCVLMYAQRGHGKRSSYYSDFTFGVWAADGALTPVGKSYFGFTDEELRWLDKWVRDHAIGKFGPVREVEKALVLEIAFDALNLSTRHKSGVAMRFPRIHRIRSDKPAHEADTLEGLRRALT